MSVPRNPVVLHCLGWVTRGGVEQLRMLLAENLVNADFRHILICQEATSPLRDRLQNAGWPVFEIGLAKNPFDLGWYLRALRVARTVKPDIIHGAVSEGNLLATFLGFVFHAPKVIIEGQSDFRGRRWGGDLLFFLMASRAKAIVGVAPQIAEQIRRKVGMFSYKVRCITNGVETHPQVSNRRVESIRRTYGIRGKDLVLESVGRLLDSHKRFSDVIRVLARLSGDFPRLKLLIVGDGVDRDSLEALASNLGMETRVIFAGYQARPREFLDVMDVFVLASSGEALPLALVEASHAGLPSVGSRVGGIPHVLNDGEAGMLFDSGDLVQLEEKLRSLLESSELRHQIGSAARARAQQHFSSARYTQEVQDLWNEVLGF